MKAAKPRFSRLPIHALPLLAVLVAALAGGACRTARDSPAPTSPADPTPTAAAGARAYSNKIRWKTASELDNFGFDVYRSESPDGPFVRINPEVVAGAGTSDEVHAYEFLDTTIDPHQTYYYYVESISMAGERERFTPVEKAGPKIGAAEEEAEGEGPGEGES